MLTPSRTFTASNRLGSLEQKGIPHRDLVARFLLVLSATQNDA